MEKSRGLPKVTPLYSKEPRLQLGPADPKIYFLSTVHSHCPPYQLGISLMPVSAKGASRHDRTSGSKAPLIPLMWFPAYSAEIPEEGHGAGQGAGAPFRSRAPRQQGLRLTPEGLSSGPAKPSLKMVCAVGGLAGTDPSA